MVRKGPSIRILGVHRVPIEVTEWAAQRKPSGPHAGDLNHLWLLEIVIENPDREFDQVEYTQAQPEISVDEWQIAYEERHLDSRGMRERKPQPGKTDRVAFFFHYLDLGKPLLTPVGGIPVPLPTPFPDRLRKIVHYIAPC